MYAHLYIYSVLDSIMISRDLDRKFNYHGC